jgi:hypothetical protein
MLGVKTKGKDSMRWLASKPFFLISLRICVAKWILIIHNGFIVVNTGRSQRLEIVIYRVVGRQGVDFERSHQ